MTSEISKFSLENKNKMKKLNTWSSIFIIFSAVLLGIETTMHHEIEKLDVFTIFDILIIIYFTIEIVLRYKYSRDYHIKDFIRIILGLTQIKKEKARPSAQDLKIIEHWLWFIFDFLLVIFGYLSFIRHFIDHPQLILMLRLFRIFRILRIFELDETLKNIEKKIISVIPTIITFLVLIFLILYSYAIIGMNLYDYKKLESLDFTNLYTSMMSLFIMMTNGWATPLIELKTNSTIPSVMSDIYVISFFIFSVLVTLNVFLAVMTSQIQEKLNADQKIIKSDLNGIIQSEIEIKESIDEIEKNEVKETKDLESIQAKLDVIMKELSHIKKNNS
jgi:voltage-gated sodium channel